MVARYDASASSLSVGRFFVPGLLPTSSFFTTGEVGFDGEWHPRRLRVGTMCAVYSALRTCCARVSNYTRVHAVWIGKLITYFARSVASLIHGTTRNMDIQMSVHRCTSMHRKHKIHSDTDLGNGTSPCRVRPQYDYLVRSELPAIIMLDHLFQMTCSASPGLPPLFVDSGANDGIWYEPVP